MLTMEVIVPFADLRARPDHRSERVSQVLFGHQVEVEKRGEQGFSYVSMSDGYSGWIADSYLSEPQAAGTHIVTSNFATLTHRDATRLFILPHGSILCQSGNDQTFSFTGEAVLDVSSGSLVRLGEETVDDPIAIALQFHSCPYLWGGVSPYGFDCSGLVQAVFRRCDVNIPRDTREQCQVGEATTWIDSIPGDLIFFPGHVAIHIGGQRIIHATRLRGMVAAESLDPKRSDCRHDLIDKITCVRRVMYPPSERGGNHV